MFVAFATGTCSHTVKDYQPKLDLDIGPDFLRTNVKDCVLCRCQDFALGVSSSVTKQRTEVC